MTRSLDRLHERNRELEVSERLVPAALLLKATALAARKVPDLNGYKPAGHGFWPPSPEHNKACEAISLRRHCPDQVLGVAIRLSPDDLSAFPADHHRGCNHPGRLRGMAPSLVPQVSPVCPALYVILGAERPDHEGL